MRSKIREGEIHWILVIGSHPYPLPFHFAMQPVAFAAKKGGRIRRPFGSMSWDMASHLRGTSLAISHGKSHVFLDFFWIKKGLELRVDFRVKSHGNRHGKPCLFDRGPEHARHFPSLSMIPASRSLYMYPLTKWVPWRFSWQFSWQFLNCNELETSWKSSRK